MFVAGAIWVLHVKRCRCSVTNVPVERRGSKLHFRREERPSFLFAVVNSVLTLSLPLDVLQNGGAQVRILAAAVIPK